MRKLFFLLLLACVGCGSQEDITSLSGTRMTISWEVKIAEKLTRQECTKVEKAVEAVFARIDNVYNNWNPRSEISKLNQLKAEERVEISEELAQFIHRVGEFVHFTEGRFDPTVGALQQLYKRSFLLSLMPESQLVEELKCCVGWDKVHLEGRIFWKDHAKIAIDLNGVAKGYAVDLITESLHALGYKDLYVEWGGEIKTMGSHKNGSPWRIAIVGGEVIEMKDEAIATSGTFYQRWTIEGVTYTHIIDPHQQTPLLVTKESIPSAAVKSSSCAESDAIATALMLFHSTEEARSWIAAKGIAAWIID